MSLSSHAVLIGTARSRSRRLRKVFMVRLREQPDGGRLDEFFFGVGVRHRALGVAYHGCLRLLKDCQR